MADRTSADTAPTALTAPNTKPADAESERLRQDATRGANWKRWGPYLSERQWGTVREDYSPDGDCWDYFPHDHARSRAYRWGEDGLLGISRPRVPALLRAGPVERQGPDPQGTAVRPHRRRGQPRRGRQGVYFYLDSTPTHSYMKGLYKYPQAEFPYDRLVDENRRAAKKRAGVRDHRHRRLRRATATSTCRPSTPRPAPNDILIRITVANRGAGGGRRFTCCRRSGSATPGRGAARTKAARSSRGIAQDGPDGGRGRPPDARAASGSRSSPRRGATGPRRRCSSPRTRPTSSALLRRPEHRAST